MHQFLTGDELGNLKAVQCYQQEGSEWKIDQRVLHAPVVGIDPESGGVDAKQVKENAIQQLALSSSSSPTTLLAAARNNGTISAFEWNAEESNLQPVAEWKDTRFKTAHSFVGLDFSKQGIFWCTLNGSLGFARVDSDSELLSQSTLYYQKISLPTRLQAWRLGPGGTTFAYGGNEVDLAVWDTEEALRANGNTQDTATESSIVNSGQKKRKLAQGLLAGEIWRARNLPNDSLGLRQPINITSLTYISSSVDDPMPKPTNHIVTGTEQGYVRRYDIRAARRPIANWFGIAKVGGVGVVQAGYSENELFVADKGSALSAVDLRTGRIIYSYKTLQGAVTSLAPAPGNLLFSTARDRFFRFHSTVPPSEAVSPQQQNSRGNVLLSAYAKSVATAVAVDLSPGGRGKMTEEEDEEPDHVWEIMPNAKDSEEEGEMKKAKHHT